MSETLLERLQVALSPHRLVHNGPLWWLCAGCRRLRREFGS